MKIAILVSGRGTNMRALARAIAAGSIRAEIALVLSNRAEAPALPLATAFGIPTLALPHQPYPTRESHDLAIEKELRARQVEVICLAGYDRILSPPLVRAFRGHILNVHPSLLPAFPGRNAQHQAWQHGVAVSGATVHVVDEQLDHGPILMQESVPVFPSDTTESLAARILEVEHRIYPAAVRRFLDNAFRFEGRRLVS